MSARVKVSPGLIWTHGETFQPGPRSRAAFAPMPSVARPPWPGAPEKFSGLIDRERASDSRVRSFMPFGQAIYLSACGWLGLVRLLRSYAANCRMQEPRRVPPWSHGSRRVAPYQRHKPPSRFRVASGRDTLPGYAPAVPSRPGRQPAPPARTAAHTRALQEWRAVGRSTARAGGRRGPDGARSTARHRARDLHRWRISPRLMDHRHGRCG